MFERFMEKEVTYVKKKNPLPSQNLGCVYKGKVNDYRMLIQKDVKAKVA